ncbi:MAG: hypothetical protein ACE5I3_04205 [Phycisphaerae bacterium]
MSDRRQLRPRLLFVVWATPSVVLLGCTRPSAALELTSYKDPYFPETYEVALADCAYYVGPGGDYHVVGRASHTPEDGTGGTITQLLHVHLFWKPRPGKTFDNPTTVDAIIRYAIVTDSGVAVYSGTGFVYPKRRRVSDELIAEIEIARLRLDSEAGDAPELLGAARLTGKLVAQNNASLAVDLRRQLDLHAGPRKPE